MVSAFPLSHLPSPVRRNDAPDCEVAKSPDISTGRVVVPVRAEQATKETTMEPRLDIMTNDVAAKVIKYFVSANKAAVDSALPAATQELMKIRASQINGCGFCLDMHTKDAAKAGETPLRLNLVAAWREAAVFTDAERAALELTEQGTRIADGGGVTDEVWANTAKHYDDDQLTAIVSQIAIINAFNRLNVILRRPAGDYQPGQLG